MPLFDSKFVYRGPLRVAMGLSMAAGFVGACGPVESESDRSVKRAIVASTTDAGVTTGVRTAIYVSQPTSVTIEINNPLDRDARIVPYDAQEPSLIVADSVKLARGIYLIHSFDTISVSGAHVETEISIRDKDEWPDPPAHVLALENAATSSSIKAFFAIAKGLEVAE
jgi:hypothetical protein